MAEERDAAECIIKYGLDSLSKLGRAATICEEIDVLDWKLLTDTAKIVQLDVDLFRDMFIDVRKRAPQLLQLASARQEGDPIILGILYDINGISRIVIKISTVCRLCKSRYLYDVYSNGNAAVPGYRFYPTQRQHVRVTQDVFWTRPLCSFFASNIVHCQATFHGFTETFRECFSAINGFNDKHASAAFFRSEIESELRERNMTNFEFSNDTDLDEILPEFDQRRCMDIYAHECLSKCKESGGGVLYSVDGLWNTHFVHCAFVQNNTINEIQLVNFPNICPQEPIRKQGELYCAMHAAVAESMKLPRNKRELTADNLNCAKLHLQGASQFLVAASQETNSLELPNGEIILPPGVESRNQDSASLPPCRKNLGEPSRQPTRSRGYLVVARACGHIEMFCPIYKSESLSQAFLFLLCWMYRKLKDVPPDQWPNIFLAYDNMCHLDAFAKKKALPLQPPFDRLWTHGMTKVIDTFHLGNHVGHSCHTLYNPSQIRAKYPHLKETNTQCCEQTFRWLGRYRLALFNMPKYRQLFFLHRIISRRNRFLVKAAQLQADADLD